MVVRPFSRAPNEGKDTSYPTRETGPHMELINNFQDSI